MGENPFEAIENVVGLVLVIAAVAAIVVFQRTVSWTSLAVMLGALLVLLGVLARYNSRFR